MTEEQWYYDLKTGSVVPEGDAPSKNRLGPFRSREEAGKALETIRNREDRKSAEDRAWNEGDG